MKCVVVFALLGCLCPQIFGFNLFVGVHSPSTPVEMKNRVKRNEGMASTTIVSSYHVTSIIRARYCSTSAVATLVNEDDHSQGVAFTFQMQPGAFISEFLMIVGGVTYKAQIQERKAAEKAYDEAVSKGESAAQVSQDSSASSRFKIDLNIQRFTTVVFNLTYQELLVRDKRRFTHKMHIAAGQVTDLRADVDIFEPQGLFVVEAVWIPSLPSDQIIPNVTFDSPSNSANVVFNPSKHIQSDVSSIDGLNGVLMVTYDVVHPLDGGDLVISNGYFVHHISPEGLPPAPKKVIFVIDVSASMWGPKMTQTVTALVSILDELRDIDQFNILLFSDDVEYWADVPVPATIENKLEAQDYVRCLRARSATNIHAALIAAAEQFNVTDDAFPAIVFLTDGRPNMGITHPVEIVNRVKEAIGDNVALFCIGIGPDVDDALLETLALENQGLYRKIFIDSSAATQMCGFFEEVATPLLYHVSIRYRDGSVDPDSLTDDDFLSYLDGKELVVAGKVADDFTGDTLDVVVTGQGLNERIQLDASQKINELINPYMVDDFAERMWAFLTISDCLKRARRHTLPEDERPDANALNARALELSLRYSFVTSMASFLILRPPEVVPTERMPLATTQLALVQPHRLTPQAIREKEKEQTFTKKGEEIHGEWALPVTKKGDETFTHIKGYDAEEKNASTNFTIWMRVGADPHFIIDIPHTDLTICFDIQAENGTYLSLISDPELDIYVNAKITPVNHPRPRPRPINSPPPSLLGSLGIQLGYYTVLVTPQKVVVDSEIVMEWGIHRSVVIDVYNITVINAQKLMITIDDDITMHVTLHNQGLHHPDHLDFFVKNDKGFSPKVHGLLGQFEYKPMYLVNPSDGYSANGHVKGIMNINGHDKYVVKMKEAIDHMYDCWWSIPETYIDGTADQYFMDSYFSRLDDIFE